MIKSNFIKLKIMIPLVLICLFSFPCLVHGAENQDEEPTSSTLRVPLIELSEDAITNILEVRSREIPFFMRSVFLHDVFFCFLDSTSVLMRVTSGISLIHLSSLEDLNTASDYTKSAARWGYWFGVSSLVSGIGDLLTFGYNANFSLKTFSSLVKDTIKYHEGNNIVLGRENVITFLDYAIGEYIDTYQRRGVFNVRRFETLLKQYNRW